MTATHLKTPIGMIPIRGHIIERNSKMSDREVADQAFKSIPGFIEPESFAELLHRRLTGRGMFEMDTYRLIEAREAAGEAAP